jgi:hypothetical protein
MITFGKLCRVATESFIYVSCDSYVYVLISCEEKIPEIPVAEVTGS